MASELLHHIASAHEYLGGTTKELLREDTASALDMIRRARAFAQEAERIIQSLDLIAGYKRDLAQAENRAAVKTC